MLNKNLNLFVKKCFGDLIINYIDVGSSLPLNKLALFFKKQFNFIFFEPNLIEFLILKEYLNKNFTNYKVYNSAISNLNKINFHNYNNYKLSSAHMLDKKYQEIYRKVKLNKKTLFKCEKLQKVLQKVKKNEVFFLKIDTQGHSLNVIKSLGKKINQIACLVVEVDKVPTYKNSFSAAHTDLYLKKNNFLELGTINDYRWSKNIKNKKYRYLGKELSYSEDKIYIKNIFTKNININDIKLIILFCIIFDYLDFSDFLIEKNKKKLGKKFSAFAKKEIRSKLIYNEKFIKENLKLFYKNKISLSYLIQILDKFSEIFSKKYVF